MGSHGKIKLLLKYKKHLEKIGDEITHVHPLKFLGVIYSNPSLKQYMNIVLDDFFKSYNFINGLGSAMEDQLKNSNVYLYLDDFCRDVNADKETVRNYIDKKNWKKLLLFLCKN
jgi:hypothetical protein